MRRQYFKTILHVLRSRLKVYPGARGQKIHTGLLWCWRVLSLIKFLLCAGLWVVLCLFLLATPWGICGVMVLSGFQRVKRKHRKSKYVAWDGSASSEHRQAWHPTPEPPHVHETLSTTSHSSRKNKSPGGNAGSQHKSRWEGFTDTLPRGLLAKRLLWL